MIEGQHPDIVLLWVVTLLAGEVKNRVWFLDPPLKLNLELWPQAYVNLCG
jgi:hypothetical protein